MDTPPPGADQPPSGDQPTTPGGEWQPQPLPNNPTPPPARPFAQQPRPPQPYPGAYGQPPYGPYPPYASYPSYAPYGPPPVQQPPRSSNKGLWIGLSILGAVILLSCVGCAVGFGLLINAANRTFTSSFGPELTASELCTSEGDSDYVAVYNLFSSNLQNQMTQDQFVQESQTREQTNGVVRDCLAGAVSQSQDGSMRVAITLTLNDGQHQGFLTLVQSSGIWQIDSYDQSLGLT